MTDIKVNSSEMHEQTERPGQMFSVETQSIIRDRYERAAKVCVDKVTLEVGGGAGFGAKYLSGFCKEFHCLEYSQENLEVIDGYSLPSVQVQIGDAHKMPYAKNTFECVVALAMIYYLSLDDFLSEVSRVLGVGGELFFCTSNKDVPGFVPSPHTREYYSVPELCQRLRHFGFDVQVEGAFPAPYQGTWAHIRAVVKRIFKAMAFVLPFGVRGWNTLRNRQLGGLVPLPNTISEMVAHDGFSQILSSTSIDRTHRIIYLTAKKISA